MGEPKLWFNGCRGLSEGELKLSFPQRSEIALAALGSPPFGNFPKIHPFWRAVASLREAILYQIGCLFTHCVNGPSVAHAHVVDFRHKF